jgi:hypothetical protein
MKTTISFVLAAFLIVLGCSKSGDFTVTQDENQLKSAITASPIAELKSARTASPITPWATPGAITIWDNNDVLMTALWAPPGIAPSGKDDKYPYYSFHQLEYDFSPYYVNGETEYNPANYDLMTHFGYFSPEDVDNAVVEFTFPHIKYFLPHMLVSDASGEDTRRIFTVNNDNNQTVITCITDLKKAHWNTAVNPPKLIGSPMFCFLIKVDCGKGKSGLTTFWTDMKVNGVSVKGTIKNKVFACN